MWRTLLILGRVSNLPTVWTNVLAGWFLAGGSWGSELLLLELGVSLLYVAGMTLNDAFDASWDRRHAPERPIPGGAISRKAVWLVGVAQLTAGVVVLSQGTAAGIAWVGALVGAILLYDAIHKKTRFAVLAMGACRGLVYVLAGSAANPGQTVWWAAIATAIYVVGITLAARSERTGHETGGGLAGSVDLLLFTPVFAAVLAMPSDGFTKLIAALAMAPFAAWISLALHHRRRTGAVGPMIGALIAGIVLIDAAILFLADAPAVAVLALALLPVTRWAQRRIPAT